MKRLPTTLLLTISTANIILTKQHAQQQNLSENTSKSNYKATIFLLHVSITNLTSPSIPTVKKYQIHSRKHNGQAQSIYLNAFINLIRYQMCTINSHKITVAS